MNVQVDVVVLGGLLITVDASFDKPDRSVGEWGPQLIDWEITHVANKRKRNTDWILKRMDALDERRVSEACYAAL